MYHLTFGQVWIKYLLPVRYFSTAGLPYSKVSVFMHFEKVFFLNCLILEAKHQRDRLLRCTSSLSLCSHTLMIVCHFPIGASAEHDAAEL